MDEADEPRVDLTEAGAPETVKALVLAAGEGTRLRPLTLDRPKPMVPIGGSPLLEHLLGLLRHHSIVEVAVNLHYKPDAIVEYCGDGTPFGVSITYSREPRLLGSAGAAKRLQRFLDRTFVVLYGDVLTDADLGALVREHRRRHALATLLLHEVPDPTRHGIAELASDGRIVRFVEKPRPDAVFSRLANAGVYILEPSILSFVPPDEPCDFGQDVFPSLIQQGLPIYGQCLEGCYALDIGSPERYAQAEHDFSIGAFQSFLGA
jgi:NDP-sugar pyrophosphorylase family protein